MAFIGTLQKRTFMDDLASGMQAGAPLAQMLQNKQQQKEEQEKKLIQFIMTQYQNTDEEGRRAMEADPNWAQFQALMAKHGLSTMMPGGKMIMPEEKPLTLEQLKSQTYGTLPLEQQQKIVTGEEPAPFEPKKHGYQWALEQYQQGNRDPEILKLVFGYEVKEAKEEKGHVLKPGESFVDATGKVIITMPGESRILKPGESVIDAKGKTITTAPMSELERATLALKEKAEERLTREGVWENLRKLKELDQTKVLKLAELDQVKFLKLRDLDQTRLLTLRDQDLTKALTLSDQALRKLLGLSDIEMQRAIAMSDQELTRFLGVEKLKVEKEKLEIEWGKLSVEKKLASIKEREAEIGESYKLGMLGVAEGELVRKTKADEAANKVTMLNQRRADAALKSLDQFRKAQTAEGVARIQNMNGVLEFEKEKFNTTHEHNIAQDEFLNELKTKIADQTDAKLVLETTVAKWNKSRDDAQLSLEQLKEEHQDLLGWSQVVEAREKNRLLEQANTIKQFIADYEKEIGFIETKIKQSEFDLKEWEKRQTVPAGVAKTEAETREIIDKMGRPELVTLKPGETLFEYKGRAEKPLTQLKEMPADPEKQKNIFMDLMGKAITDVKKTYPSAMLSTMSEEKRLKYSKEVMKRAYPLFVDYLKTEPNLTSDDKSYYSNLAREFMIAEKAEVKVPPGKQKGRLTATDVSKMIKDFIFGGEQKPEQPSTRNIRDDLNTFLQRNENATRPEAREYLNGLGYSDDEINSLFGK